MSGRIFTYTPVGHLEIISDGSSLVGIRSCPEPFGDVSGDAVTAEAERQLAEYFAGDRRRFELPLRQEVQKPAVPQGTPWGKILS